MYFLHTTLNLIFLKNLFLKIELVQDGENFVKFKNRKMRKKKKILATFYIN